MKVKNREKKKRTKILESFEPSDHLYGGIESTTTVTTI